MQIDLHLDELGGSLKFDAIEVTESVATGPEFWIGPDAETALHFVNGQIGLGTQAFPKIGGQAGYRSLTIQGEYMGGGGIELVNGSGGGAAAEWGKVEFINMASGVKIGRATFNVETDSGDSRHAFFGWWIENPGDGDSLGVMKLDHLGNLGLGTLDGIKPITTSGEKMRIAGHAVVYGATRRVLRLDDKSDYAEGVGPGFLFAGRYNEAGDFAGFAGIKGVKENATDGDDAGAFVVAVKPNGADPIEGLRVTSAGAIKTPYPNNGAGAWKFGKVVTVNQVPCLEVMVDGTTRNLVLL